MAAVTTHAAAISTLSTSSDRMSAGAVALTVLLHTAVALALWWISTHRPTVPSDPEPIEVTIEQPKPAEPPPPPAPKHETPKEIPPLGLRPPAEITSDKPTQVYSTPERSLDARPPHPDTTLEQALPPPEPEAPPPPQAAFEPPKAALPSAPQQSQGNVALLPKPATPQQQLQQPQQQHNTEIRPSPLSHLQQPRRPNASARNEEPAPSPFINPADTYNRARVADNYLWQIVRKLQGYHYTAEVQVTEGTTVIRIVVARDGRLLDAQIARSSGYTALDRGVLEGVRAGSPYAPLPPNIEGSSATFTLPLVSYHHD